MAGNYVNLPIENSTGTGITGLTGDVTATGPGSATASLTATSNSTLTTLSGLSLPTSQLSGVLSPTKGGAAPVTKMLYVDGGRTDSYTADGSMARPFKTISTAITQIITNADNSTHPYNILVYPFSYSETLSFNSSTLYNITISALISGVYPFQGTSVTGITSTSNNTQLANLIFNNITVNGAVNLTGDTNGTNFASTQVLFSACQFNNGGSTFVLNNINNVNFYSCQIQGSGSVATFTNVAFAYMEGPEGFIGGTTLHLVQNNAGNQPSQAEGNYFLMSSSKFYGTMTVDAGSELDSLLSYFGSTSAVTNNGTIHSWGTNWAGTTALTLNNGSTYRNRGDIVWTPHVVNSGATIQNQDYAYMLGGVFGTTAVPATNAAVVTKDGHLKSTQTTAPTTTTNANAGSGASSSVSHATDNAGSLSLTTGTSTWASGVQTTVNFNLAYNAAPIVTLTPSDSAAATESVSRGVYVTSTVNGFSVNFANADTTQTTYTWNYSVVETQ